MNKTYNDRREYMRAYQARWIKARRDAFFKNKTCASCGSNSKLEIDHINPQEKVSHRIWSWSKERMASELLKCQVLCYSCHKKKTKSSYRGLVHGTVNGYGYYGCRCDLCRKALANKRAEYRARTGKR